MEKAQKEKLKCGRPKKEKAKLIPSINLKLTESDYEAIRQKAENIGMTATQYAREMTLKGEVRSRYTKEELDVRRKIAGMANNMNQLARKANADGYKRVEIEAGYMLSWLKVLLDDGEK